MRTSRPAAVAVRHHLSSDVLQLIGTGTAASLALVVQSHGDVLQAPLADRRAPLRGVVQVARSWAGRGTDSSAILEIKGWPTLLVRMAVHPPMALALVREPGSTWTATDADAVELALAVHTVTLRGEVETPAHARGPAASSDDGQPTEAQLRGAVESGALRLHFQAEIDLRSGALVGVEALVRWQHPTYGLLAPEAFIDVAEHSRPSTGLVSWVLDAACGQAAAWSAAYPAMPFVVRVNVSPTDLTDQGFVPAVMTILARHDVAPQRLSLEITERVVAPDLDDLASAVEQLRALGVGTALDDFGTGYSSMAHLKVLHVDAVKIDRRFTHGLGSDVGNAAIVDAIARLATTFGLDVIAEGVETTDEVAALLRLGCHRGQGHLFGSPAPADQLAGMLRNGGVADRLPFRT